MTQLLHGIRVLDLTNVLSGPFCTHQLVHFGAEVIKIEAPGRGDLARQLGADPDLNAKYMGASFLAQNAGKKSVSLNLKDPLGRELFLKLVSKADVVVENFRPGVMDRLDLSWPTLKKVNNRLVYCAISGFGQDGPWAKRPAYDQIVQGLSGVMANTGDKESAPLRVGYPIADTIGGLTAAMAICAALTKRQATLIDVSMLESVLVTTGWVVSNWLVAGQKPVPLGNDNPTSAPSGIFRTSDGPINIAANKEEQWKSLVRHIKREDLLENPDYLTREDRKRNRQALKVEIEAAIGNQKATKLADELTAIGVPAGPVMTVPEILEHPVISDRGLIATFEDVPGLGRNIQSVRTGVKVNKTAPSVETPPPVLGANNSEVLGELGLNLQDIEQLRESGVI
jgi:crotonobetainyl-CoA:carnitine CoA-transferase CaiB-like acyl-CoA transferase